MNLGLAGSVAVVVGAASGIGKAIAQAFARERAAVALIDKSDAVNAATAEVAGGHDKHLALVGDVTDSAAMVQLAKQVTDKYGHYEHVVFAAGRASGKYGFPFWNLEPADWDQVLRVNLIGAVNIAHAFAPVLVQRKYGSLLFISSVSGQIGSQTDPPYSASKAGLINFAQCAAKDLAPYGVRVNSVCPGMVKTPLNRSIWEAWCKQQPPEQQLSFEEWSEQKIKRVVPLGRWQTTFEIADMVVFLCSQKARSVTGQTINVDGGFVMHW